MLKDSRSYESQIIDAVRSVNRALGGTYGTSSAIHKSDFNQYEVQLIDAIRGIGRTLSGKGLSLAGGAGVGDLSGYATIAQFQDLSRRVTTLENESFFRLVDGNVTLKSQYQNLWVPGWLAAGGVGTGSGGGGGSVEHLSDIGDVTIDTTTLAEGQGIVWDATNNVWKNANVGGGGGGSGTVTSVGISVPTGLSVTGSPVTSSGTITIRYSSGYRIPTTSKQSSWDAKQDAISDLSTIRANAANGQTAYGWGDHSLAGYLTSETDPTVPAWAKAQNPLLYIGTTRVQTTETPQDLTGILSVKATSASASQFVWEPNAGGTGIGAWHFLGNIYADGWIAAGGIGSGSSGGSVVSISNLLSSGTRIATITINGTDYNILAPSGSSGAVTRIDLGNTTYSPVGGVVSLPAYPTTLPASDVYAWAKASSKPSYSLSEISGTDDLRAIEALTGTSGFLKKTAANTWTLDTTSYLSSGTTLDNIADGNTRKLANYLPLAGGTMTGTISMNGADIIPSADLGSQLGYSNRRFSDINARTLSVKEINFKNSSNNAKTGYLSFGDGYMILCAGSNIDSSYKQINFHETYGLYPENGSSVNLGYHSSTDDRFRWANIYSVNADLSGDLSLAQTGHIDIGPLRIEYDATNKALHITKKDNSDINTYGFYCDGWVAAGGVGQTS